jgi:hypothetical protein
VSWELPSRVVQHLWQRQLASLAALVPPDRYPGMGAFAYFSNGTASLDHGTWLRGPGTFALAVRSTPFICQEIDAGRLVVLGIVTTYNFPLWFLSVAQNHVEVVYGYTRTGDTLRLHVSTATILGGTTAKSSSRPRMRPPQGLSERMQPTIPRSRGWFAASSLSTTRQSIRSRPT